MKKSIFSGNFSLFAYFIILSFLGSVLLSMPFACKPGVSISFIDALFTSVSAVCVTGLSTLSMDLFSPAGFVILLFLIEFGGLGILTFISLLIALPSKKVSVSNSKMIRDFFIDDVEYQPRKILKRIIISTLIIQFTGFLLLMPGLYAAGDQNFIFDSLFLSISAFCNAGFSTRADSLIHFSSNWYILSIIMILIILGGTGFVVFSDIGTKFKKFRQGKPHYLSLHAKIVLIFTAVLIVIGTVVTFILSYNHCLKSDSCGQKILTSLFESVTLRTAGFETVPQKEFTPAVSLFHLVLMFTGGSPGSIAGGVKTTTIFVAFLYAFNGNEKSNTLSIGNRNLSSASVNKAITIVSRSFIMLTVSIFFLAIAEQNNLMSGKFSVLDILYESTSAFATVGLTRGITGDLTFFGKIVIILTMYIGRTGIFAMAFKLFKTDEELEAITYPQENIMIG